MIHTYTMHTYIYIYGSGSTYLNTDTATELHRQGELVVQQLQHIEDSFFPRVSQAPQHRPPDEHRLGAQSNRLYRQVM